jgi:hypothetical protein
VRDRRHPRLLVAHLAPRIDPTRGPRRNITLRLVRRTETLEEACGDNGRLYQKSGSTWGRLPGKPPTFQSLHAIWIDDEGAIWAAGGELTFEPPVAGVLIRYGTSISTEIEE